MADNEKVQKGFEAALARLTQKLKQDRNILAAILCGSLSYDAVWEKSDIDLLLIASENLKTSKGFCLVEDGINIHASVYSRSRFKAALQSSLQSSFLHSLFSKSTLLFSHDETIQELYENIYHVGERDREIQLLRAGTWVLPGLVKAEKWFAVRGDLHYSFLWIMKTLDALATIEVLQQGEIAGREVVLQALRHNPAFFGAIYTDLIDGPKTPVTLGEALHRINGYLRERTLILFRPLLDYLAASGGVRSSTEINHHFSNQMNLEGVDLACEWLADQSVIEKVATPVRLTQKSRVDLEEAAYYYEGESAR